MDKIGLRKILRSSATPALKALKLCDYAAGSLAAALVSAQPAVKPDPKISNMLVIRPGGIGDAVFLLPVFKAIKSGHPQISIDVLCQRRNAQVFSSQQHLVDGVFVYGSPADLKTVLAKSYDRVVDTEQWHYLTALTAAMTKARVRSGFATRPLRRKFFNHSVDYAEDGYELDNFLSLFDDLTGRSAMGSIDDCFHLPQRLKSWAEDRIPLNTVAVSIAASVPERRLATSQVVSLMRGLVRRGCSVALLGGKDSEGQAREVMAGLNSEGIYNFAGRTSLAESAALINRSNTFIGTDSGLMHLACGVGTRVIALFGPGNMKKWAPQHSRHAVISRHAPCAPCTSFGYGIPVCRGEFHCLRQMDMELILNTHFDGSDSSLRARGKNE